MSHMTPKQVSSFTPNGQALVRVGEAIARGDHEAAWEARKDVIYPAEALLAAKRNMGADWIRKRGLNTQKADEKYGKDWLDRDI
jgi:hypothetical protein